MPRVKVDEMVEELTKPIAQSFGIELIDVEYKKEGTGYVLRVTIDKPGGVTIEDCENISRSLDVKLDEADPIEQSYSLEVQSPGERSLRRDREFEYFKGRDVEVKLYEAIDGRKLYEGKLLGLENDTIKIMLNDGSERGFDRNKVSSVKLKINF